MGQYLSNEQMVDIFGIVEIRQCTGLGDSKNPPTEVNDDRLSEAIDYAESEANSYLGVRYVLPLTQVPVVLRYKCADIARFRLDRNLTREEVRKRYEEAIAWLEKIASGELNLGLTAVPAPVVADQVGAIIYESPEPVFSRDEDNFLSTY